MKLKISFLCAVLLLTMTNCGVQMDESSCERLLTESSHGDPNTAMQLSVPSHMNSFKIEDDIAVVVHNKSNTAIEIVPDQDIHVYVWKDKIWSLVENDVDYLSLIERISPKTNDDPGITIYSILLELPKQSNPVRVCITLEGVRDPDGSKTKIAAYTEALLNP